MQFCILQARRKMIQWKKKSRKKKRLVVVALFTQFQHLIFRLYDLSLRIFLSPTGGSKINICYNTGDSLSPIKCGQKTFFFSPLAISLQYSLGNFTYLKIIIDFLAIGFGSCGFWCRCKTHFIINTSISYQIVNTNNQQFKSYPIIAINNKWLSWIWDD